jgi:Arc/MetJ family transcription regulator
MRLTIDIDGDLMNRALAVSGCKTKNEAVEEGLKLLIARKGQGEIRALRGKLSWEGDLERMRNDG